MFSYKIFNKSINFTLFGLLIYSLLLSFDKSANAIVRRTEYDQSHRFGVMPSIGMPLPSDYRGFWSSRGITRATDFTRCSKSDEHKRQIINIAPNLNLTRNSMSDCPHADSMAESSVSFNNFGPAESLIGEIQVSGFAEISPPNREPSSARAFSDSFVILQAGFLKRGRWTWTPRWRLKVSSGASNLSGLIVGKDPIDLTVIEPSTGDTLLTTTLIDINSSLKGNGEMFWDDNNVVFIDTDFDASFSIDISSPFSVQQGNLNILIKDGIVKEAYDSGIFDGIIPDGVIGTDNPLNLLINEIVLDYDLGFEDTEVDVIANLFGSGLAQVSIPESSSVLSLFILSSLGMILSIKNKYKN